MSEGTADLRAPQRVVGIGQRAAGDDGVGGYVVAALRKEQLPQGVVLHELSDATQLMPLLDDASQVVVVDALVSASAEPVSTLTLAELSTVSMSSVSSHGLSVPQAIELAHSLSSDACRNVTVVAVRIAAPKVYQEGLSPGVAAAVPVAAEAVKQLLEDFHA